MLGPEDLSGYLEETMPELSGVVKEHKSQSVYDIVRDILMYTKTQLVKHNMNAAKKCMSLVEQLYFKGNTAVRNAIENVFVYSFSYAFFHDDDNKQQAMAIVPDSLYQLYKAQVLNSHL